MRAGILIVGCGLFLIGCNETPQTHYATVSAAVQDRAFERGVLPTVLQPDVTDIHEMHDIDSNRVVGQFALNGAVQERLQSSCKRASSDPPHIPSDWFPHVSRERLRTLEVVRCDDFFVATDTRNRIGYFWA